MTKNEKTFGVYVPSYNRFEDKKRMYDCLEYCTYVVRKSEASEYIANGIDRLWIIEDSLIDNIQKTFQYIIDNSKEDIICIIDDDGKMIYRNVTSRDMTKEEASMEIERVAVMMNDLGIGYACTDAVPAPFYYTQEFCFKGMSGGCKWINKEKFKAKIDFKTNYNFDLDWELQELLVNRIIFKPLYFIDTGGQDTNKGGSNVDKNFEKRVSGIEYMKAKWGKYFKYNYKNNKANINVKR